MAQDGVERKLVAIFATGVVGYSRLVGMDKERTIAHLKSLRANGTTNISRELYINAFNPKNAL